jgi:hypothetical protein
MNNKKDLEENILSLEQKINSLNSTSNLLNKFVDGAYGAIIGALGSFAVTFSLSFISQDIDYMVYGIPISTLCGAGIGASCSNTIKRKINSRYDNKLDRLKETYEQSYGSFEKIERPVY